ncbi:hypothetical protein DUI87_04449 [Hirundo rustica rustica]|uniref:Uncharacterized protein n=1 Tax=Hirundo rustica rustica TaxID=333673 RepID=A0A3M0LHP3_HIRRU|nr:hypothetical protein DUI87_04449 [Hirundo rustica rustica]
MVVAGRGGGGGSGGGDGGDGDERAAGLLNKKETVNVVYLSFNKAFTWVLSNFACDTKNGVDKVKLTNQDKNPTPATGLQWDERKQVSKPQTSGSKYGTCGQRLQQVLHYRDPHGPFRNVEAEEEEKSRRGKNAVALGSVMD